MKSVAKPGSDSPLITQRYAPRWYCKDNLYDASDWVYMETTGVKAPELLPGNNQPSATYLIHSKAGRIKSVQSSSRSLKER
jgi:hypothetical protein